jgi:hypothetical protein
VTGPASLAGNTLTLTGAGEVTVTATQAGNANYNAASAVSQSFNIEKAGQTISFGTLEDGTYGDAARALSASSSSGLPIAFSVTGPASLAGNTLTLTGAGEVTVTATQAGNANYNAASAVSRTFTVAKSPQTISFGALSNKTFGSADFTLNATASSGLPVMYLASGPVTISGNTVRLTGAGSVTITALQNGDLNYVGATPVARTFTVAKSSQTISFGALEDGTYGDAARTLSASSSSGLPVAFSVTGPASLAGNTLTLTGAGEVTVTATQAGNANYSAASAVSQSFNVEKAGQTISFGTLSNRTFGVSPFTLSASSSSGLPVAFSVTGPVSLSGNTLTVTGVGSVTVTATQAGNGNYYAASAVSRTFTVAKASQTISFGAISNKTFGGADFTLSATASSGLPIMYLATGPATITGNTVKLTGAGSVTITAFQNGDLNYYGATPIARTFTVAKASQTISFGELEDGTYGDAAISLSATSSSGLPVAFSVTGPASLTGNTLTLTGTGEVTVTATQAGNANYNAASAVSRSFNVEKAGQTVTFASLPNRTYGDAAISLSASSSSGLPVAFSVTGPASLTGNTLTVTGAGSVTVTATQAGNGNYYAASAVSRTFTVAKASQTISFGALEDKIFGDLPFSVSATTSTGLPVSFAITSGPASITGNTITVTGAGVVVVSASQPGDANYAVAPEVSQSFRVSPKPVTVRINDASMNIGDPMPQFTLDYSELPPQLDLGSVSLLRARPNSNWKSGGVMPMSEHTIEGPFGQPVTAWLMEDTPYHVYWQGMPVVEGDEVKATLWVRAAEGVTRRVQPVLTDNINSGTSTSGAPTISSDQWTEISVTRTFGSITNAGGARFFAVQGGSFAGGPFYVYMPRLEFLNDRRGPSFFETIGANTDGTTPGVFQITGDASALSHPNYTITVEAGELTVSNQNPTVDLLDLATSPAVNGKEHVFRVRASDPNGNLSSIAYRYRKVDYAFGIPSNPSEIENHDARWSSYVTITPTDMNAPTGSVEVSIASDSVSGLKPGSIYEFQAKAIDSTGAESDWTPLRFNVMNRDPMVSGSLLSGSLVAGETVTIRGQGSDPDGDLAAIVVIWTLNGMDMISIADQMFEANTTDGVFETFVTVPENVGANLIAYVIAADGYGISVQSEVNLGVVLPKPNKITLSAPQKRLHNGTLDLTNFVAASAESGGPVYFSIENVTGGTAEMADGNTLNLGGNGTFELKASSDAFGAFAAASDEHVTIEFRQNTPPDAQVVWWNADGVGYNQRVYNSTEGHTWTIGEVPTIRLNGRSNDYGWGDLISSTGTLVAPDGTVLGSVDAATSSSQWTNPTDLKPTITQKGFYRMTTTLSDSFGITDTSTVTIEAKGMENVITFPSIADRSVSSGQFAPGATASSGLLVSYVSSDPSVASIESGMIVLHRSGTVTITALQEGDSQHEAAVPVSQSFSVTNAAPVITGISLVTLPPFNQQVHTFNVDMSDDDSNIVLIQNRYKVGVDDVYHQWVDFAPPTAVGSYRFVRNTGTLETAMPGTVYRFEARAIDAEGIASPWFVYDATVANRDPVTSISASETSGFYPGDSITIDASGLDLDRNLVSMVIEYQAEGGSWVEIDTHTVSETNAVTRSVAWTIPDIVGKAFTLRATASDASGGMQSAMVVTEPALQLANAISMELKNKVLHNGSIVLNPVAASGGPVTLSIDSVSGNAAFETDNRTLSLSGNGTIVLRATSPVFGIYGAASDLIESIEFRQDTTPEGRVVWWNAAGRTHDTRIANSAGGHVWTVGETPSVLLTAFNSDNGYWLQNAEGTFYQEHISHDSVIRAPDGSIVATVEVRNQVTEWPSHTRTFTVDQAGVYTFDIDGWDALGNHGTRHVEIPAKFTQAITFPQIPDHTFVDGGIVTPSATSSSGLPLTYSSSDPSVIEVTESVLRIRNVGTVSITAFQEGNSEFHAAEPVSITLTVTKGDQVTALAVHPFSPQMYSSSQSLVAIGGDGSGALTFEIVNSSRPEIATLEGNDLTANTGTGWVDVRVRKAGDSRYNEAVSGTSRVWFEKMPQLGLGLNPVSGLKSGETQVLRVDGNPVGTVNFRLVQKQPEDVVEFTSGDGGHEVYVRGSGYYSAEKRRSVQVDGVEVASAGRGIELAIFDRDWNVISTRRFDTYGSVTHRTELANALMSMGPDQYWVMTSQDAVRSNPSLNAAFVSLGVTSYQNYTEAEHRRPFAAIGFGSSVIYDGCNSTALDAPAVEFRVFFNGSSEIRANKAGSFDLIAEVSGDHRFLPETLSSTVTTANNAPQISSVELTSGPELFNSDTHNWNVTVEDIDGDAVQIRRRYAYMGPNETTFSEYFTWGSVGFPATDRYVAALLTSTVEGTSGHPKKMPGGVYRIEFNARDSNGEYSGWQRFDYTIPNRAPIASITVPDAGSTIRVGDTITVNGRGTDQDYNLSSVSIAAFDESTQTYVNLSSDFTGGNSNAYNAEAMLTVTRAMIGHPIALQVTVMDESGAVAVASFTTPESVSKEDNVISFPAIADRSITSPSFDPEATASSSLPVSYSSSDEAVARIENGLIVIRGTGNVTITATQMGDAIYQSADPVSRTFTVTNAAPMINSVTLTSAPFVNDKSHNFRTTWSDEDGNVDHLEARYFYRGPEESSWSTTFYWNHFVRAGTSATFTTNTVQGVGEHAKKMPGGLYRYEIRVVDREGLASEWAAWENTIVNRNPSMVVLAGGGSNQEVKYNNSIVFQITGNDADYNLDEALVRIGTGTTPSFGDIVTLPVSGGDADPTHIRVDSYEFNAAYPIGTLVTIQARYVDDQGGTNGWTTVATYTVTKLDPVITPRTLRSLASPTEGAEIWFTTSDEVERTINIEQDYEYPTE